MSTFQPLTGTRALLMYSSVLFAKSGMNPNVSTTLIGVVHFAATLLSSILLSKFGRKTILLGFCIVMTASLTCLGMLMNYGDESEVGGA